MFDELLTYVFLGTAASLFGDVPAGHRRFFSYPPVGFGLAAFPHVGYLVAVEWIGKLFVSVVSQPFFLGSPEHEAAIAALPDRDYSGDVVDLNLGDARVQSWSAQDPAGTASASAAPPPPTPLPGLGASTICRQALHGGGRGAAAPPPLAAWHGLCLRLRALTPTTSLPPPAAPRARRWRGGQ
jgi:hypothetical protein